MLDFPQNPSVGATYQDGGKTYVWTGNRWAVQRVEGDPRSVLSVLPSGRRNLLINGAFDVWQRGNAAFALNVYTADRWMMLRNGYTIDVSQLTLPPGTEPVPGHRGALRAEFSATSPTAGSYAEVYQPVENVALAQGQMTISFYAKCLEAGGKKLGVDMVQVFGSGGSTAESTQVGTVDLTNTWQRFVLPATLPSIVGKNFGAGHCVWLRFWFALGENIIPAASFPGGGPGLQNGTIDITGVQLEEGPVATPFERRPIGEELILCQRYYQHFSSNYSIAKHASGSNLGLGDMTLLPVAMRATPTASFSTSNLSNCTSPSVITTPYSMHPRATASGAGLMTCTFNPIMLDAEL